MKKKFLAVHAAALFLLAGCETAPKQMFYQKASLNYISIGNTKAQILDIYKRAAHGNVPGMEIRASQKNNSGKLIEVGEVLLTDGVTATVSYWFIFENGILAQWGRPEDWQQAAIRYEINYNRQPGVTQR